MLDAKTLIAILSPAAIASLFLIAARWGGRSGRWGAAAGSAIGFATGQAILLGFPSIPPVDVTEWPIVFALTAGAFGVEESIHPRRLFLDILRWICRAALVFGVIYALLLPMIRNSWTGPQSAYWIVGLGLLTAFSWLNFGGLIARLPAPASSSALFLPILALLPLLTFSHSAVLGQLGLIAASAIVPAAILAWWSRDAAPVRGVLVVGEFLMASLLISGYFYGSGLSLIGILGVALAPVLAWLAAFGPQRRWRPRLLGLVVAILLAIPLGIAVGSMARSYLAEVNEEM